MRRTDRLWKELDGPGVPPTADRRAVKRRVDAVLDDDPVERRTHMKRKFAYALAATALIAALTGSALAVSGSLDAINAYFKGDRAPVEEYLDSQPRSVSDENYTFTVNSSVSAGDNTYMTVTVKALNEETREFLFSDKFSDIDTFHVRPIMDESYTEQEQHHVMCMASGGWSKLSEDPDEDSVCYQLDANYTGNAKAVQVRLGWMEEGKMVEVPVTHAPDVTVKIGASGVGICGFETLKPGTLTIDEVTLSPLTCKIVTSKNPQVFTIPRIFFRMADGSVRTQSQMINRTSGGSVNDDKNYVFNFEMKSVQDLSEIKGIIAFDMEYPMDGSKPFAVEHDDALDPVSVTRMERLVETSGYTLPMRELTEKLGGTCEWDAESGDVTCTYRGVSIVMHAGEKTMMVDGKPVEQRYAPGVIDGKLCMDDVQAVFDAWGLDGELLRTTHYEQRQPDGSAPITWHDWYIVP